MHLFDRYCDHDYQCELLAKEEQDAHSISRCSTAHHGDFRAVPRTNRTRPTADNPIPGAASSTDKSPAAAPWQPWRSCVPAAFLSAGRFACEANPCVYDIRACGCTTNGSLMADPRSLNWQPIWREMSGLIPSRRVIRFFNLKGRNWSST